MVGKGSFLFLFSYWYIVEREEWMEYELDIFFVIFMFVSRVFNNWILIFF